MTTALVYAILALTVAVLRDSTQTARNRNMQSFAVLTLAALALMSLR